MDFENVVIKSIIAHLPMIENGSVRSLRGDEIETSIAVALSQSKDIIVQIFANDNDLRREGDRAQLIADEIKAFMKKAGYPRATVMVHIGLTLNLWGDVSAE